MSQELEKLRLESIRIKGNHRKLVEKKVIVLANSMAKIGLKTPISVRLKKDGPGLVAGHHRLEAAKRLKWKKIDCFIVNGDKIDTQLWTIAENLHRAELDAIERADRRLEGALKTAKKGCASWRSSTAR